MEIDAQSYPSADVRRYLRIASRRKWWIITPVVLSVALAWVMSGRKEVVYEAATRVSTVGIADSSLNPPVRDPAREIETQIALMRSPAIVGPAMERVTGADAVRDVGISQVGNTDFVDIAVTSTDPRVAASVANAYADSYLAYRRDNLADIYADQSKQLRSQIDNINDEIADVDDRMRSLDPLSPERASLAARRADLAQQARDLEESARQADIEESLRRSTGPQVLAKAGIPGSPVGQSRTRNLAFAAVLGLIIGWALAMAREFFDDRVHGSAGVTGVMTDLPLLATIPVMKGTKRRSRVVAADDPQSPAAEAFRYLRTQLEFARLRTDFRVIGVTSAAPLEGKSTTVANLAAAATAAGYRTIILDCDLRRPCIHDFFGLSNYIGVTTVLLGQSSLLDAMQQVELPSGGSLAVMASGPVPPNPAEVLGSGRMRALIAALRERADFVFVDTPPVGAVTDPLVLSRFMDAMLCVSRVGVSRRRQLASARRHLLDAEAPTLGVVVNGTTTDDDAPSRYRYQYMAPRMTRERGRGEVTWKALITADDEWMPRTANGNGHHDHEEPSDSRSPRVEEQER